MIRNLFVFDASLAVAVMSKADFDEEVNDGTFGSPHVAVVAGGEKVLVSKVSFHSIGLGTLCLACPALPCVFALHACLLAALPTANESTVQPALLS